MEADILEYNQSYANKNRPARTGKHPQKKLAVVSCMDTRLVRMLPDALGLKDGDAKMIKCAGAMINDPYGDVVRSLLVAVYRLGVNRIMVIGHTDCGMQALNAGSLVREMERSGILREKLEHVRQTGVNINTWLCGFQDVYASVRKSVALLREHLLMPPDITVSGYVIDVETALLHAVTDEADSALPDNVLSGSTI